MNLITRLYRYLYIAHDEPILADSFTTKYWIQVKLQHSKSSWDHFHYLHPIKRLYNALKYVPFIEILLLSPIYLFNGLRDRKLFLSNYRYHFLPLTVQYILYWTIIILTVIRS